MSIVSNGSVTALARSVLDCHPLPCHGAPRTPASAWRYVRTRGLHDAGCDAAADKCAAAGAAGCSVHRVMTGYRVGRGGAARRMEDSASNESSRRFHNQRRPPLGPSPT